MTTYGIIIQPSALKMLKSVTDMRVQNKLIEAIDSLAINPEQRGKPLTGELQPFRSLRAVGQRYRIIYKVEQHTVSVFVVTVGLRKEGNRSDVYELAKKLLRLKLVD